MKNSTAYLVSFFVIFAMFIIFKQGKKGVQAVTKIIGNMTRGYRNNNFGNIRITKDKNGKQTFWTGEVKGTDLDFKTFSTPAYGYRAIFALLKEYIGKGYNTIDKIINRYAPASENHTTNYINTVVKRTGIQPDSKIAASDLITLTKLVSAISFVENGISADEVQINEGKKLLT